MNVDDKNTGRQFHLTTVARSGPANGLDKHRGHKIMQNPNPSTGTVPQLPVLLNDYNSTNGVGMLSSGSSNRRRTKSRNGSSSSSSSSSSNRYPNVDHELPAGGKMAACSAATPPPTDSVTSLRTTHTPIQPPEEEASAAALPLENGSIRVTVIHPNDVLFGRQSQLVHFKGNMRFRKLVRKHQGEYKMARRPVKDAIARKILKDVADKGGRFLRKIETAQNQAVVAPVDGGSSSLAKSDNTGKKKVASNVVVAKEDVWVIAETELALEKVKQALRQKYDRSTAAAVSQSAKRQPSAKVKTKTTTPVAKVEPITATPEVACESLALAPTWTLPGSYCPIPMQPPQNQKIEQRLHQLQQLQVLQQQQEALEHQLLLQPPPPPQALWQVPSMQQPAPLLFPAALSSSSSLAVAQQPLSRVFSSASSLLRSGLNIGGGGGGSFLGGDTAFSSNPSTLSLDSTTPLSLFSGTSYLQQQYLHQNMQLLQQQRQQQQSQSGAASLVMPNRGNAAAQHFAANISNTTTTTTTTNATVSTAEAAAAAVEGPRASAAISSLPEEENRQGHYCQ